MPYSGKEIKDLGYGDAVSCSSRSDCVSHTARSLKICSIRECW
jgi:hypothetical protein